MSTPQQKIKELLQKTGIPAKEIEVYGSQIVITAWSLEVANKWGGIVRRFATLRGVIKSTETNKADVASNQTAWVPRDGGGMRKTFHEVWRVYGVIQ